MLLGIETSCDETGAAVLGDGGRVLSNVLASSVEFHRRYGGIVPEIASRKQIELIAPVIAQAMEQAGATFAGLDAVAVTAGPGLVGSLLVGMCAAKAIAFAALRSSGATSLRSTSAHGIPLLAVNHLEAHVYANWIESRALADDEPLEPRLPSIVLIISGGHSDLLLMEDHLAYRLLGRTRDDAAGEAFDKGARLLGLPYPGGPALDALAKKGDAGAVDFPRPTMPQTWDFSFSGLKTALARYLQRARQPVPQADVAASYQEAIVDTLVEKTLRAAGEFDVPRVLLAGGVACNSRLRQVFSERAAAGVSVAAPPPDVCTDNAAMIACAGLYRLRAGFRSPLDVDVAASLPLAGA